MTDQQSYDKAAEMSMTVSKLVKSYSEIAMFFPATFWLSELYKLMVEREEITEIKHLGSSRKLVYWVSVCEAIPGKPKWLKILSCRACYMWDLITETSINQ